PIESEIKKSLDEALHADVIVKTSGVGVYDELLERKVLELKQKGKLVIFWDVDAPATLDRIKMNEDDYFKKLIPQYDLILTYGGGDPVVNTYKSFGAKSCYPIYNALDPGTHYPVPKEKRFKADLAFLGNRLPDREKRVENFFLEVAEKMPGYKFILGGNGWND